MLMPDIRAAATDCKFYNCTHQHEPGCGVLAALARGEISESRHRIYGEIRDELGRQRF
jgi:ribosome biogenesis GTPase